MSVYQDALIAVLSNEGAVKTSDDNTPAPEGEWLTSVKLETDDKEFQSELAELQALISSNATAPRYTGEAHLPDGPERTLDGQVVANNQIVDGIHMPAYIASTPLPTVVKVIRKETNVGELVKGGVYYILDDKEVDNVIRWMREEGYYVATSPSDLNNEINRKMTDSQ